MTNIEILEIDEIVVETPTIKTFFFDWHFDIEPGQFVMIWVPGVDEMPMSLSYIYDKRGITVRNVGEGTKALHSMEPGDRIGIRGPYGNGYEIKGEKILAVVGGIGGASVLPAVEKASRENIEVDCALGAKTQKELLFLDRLYDLTNLKVATDDGSMGHPGFATDICEEMMKGVDMVITCGPEPMMKRIVQMAIHKGVPIQASLERYLKCGLGLCGSCVIDGERVCVEGPVFTGEELNNFEEFGKYDRDSSGRKKPLERPKQTY